MHILYVCIIMIFREIISVCICLYLPVSACICMYDCISSTTWASPWVSPWVSPLTLLVYVCMCMYVYVCVCICMYHYCIIAVSECIVCIGPDSPQNTTQLVTGLTASSNDLLLGQESAGPTQGDPGQVPNHFTPPSGTHPRTRFGTP